MQRVSSVTQMDHGNIILRSICNNASDFARVTDKYLSFAVYFYVGMCFY